MIIRTWTIQLSTSVLTCRLNTSKNILWSCLSSVNCIMQMLHSAVQELLLLWLNLHYIPRAITTYWIIYIYILKHWYQDTTLLLLNLKHNKRNVYTHCLSYPLHLDHTWRTVEYIQMMCHIKLWVYNTPVPMVLYTIV